MLDPIFIGTVLAAPSAAAKRLADRVVKALIDEATLTPKPGLVDLRGRGAHQDLDWALMCRSACSLQPIFRAMAVAAEMSGDARKVRDAIGHLGRVGESTMMQASGGINTHRGAIWALGLLVTAAAAHPADRDPAAIAARAGHLARIPDRFAPVKTGNKGEVACDRYGVGGARGEAAAGFPHLIGIALPQLHASRRAGRREDHARVDALLALISRLPDTCVLARGGAGALRATQQSAANVLAEGGIGSPAGRRSFRALEALMLRLNVSPGGAADLLAAALFLDAVEGHRVDVDR